MRLIDADAEIARIGQEMQRIDAKIERLKKMAVKEQFNTLHNFEKELEQCYRNKADCKTEIITLKNYQTAYDVDKVIGRLEKLPTKMVATYTGSVPVFNDNTKSFEGFVKQYEIEKEFVDKDKAIKIVRAGMKEIKGDKEA